MVMSIAQWGLGRDMFRYAGCAVFELSVFRRWKFQCDVDGKPT